MLTIKKISRGTLTATLMLFGLLLAIMYKGLPRGWPNKTQHNSIQRSWT